MSKTDLEAWLEKVEAYLKLTPENFHAAIDIKYKAIDLLKLVKKQREALSYYADPENWVEDSEKNTASVIKSDCEPDNFDLGNRNPFDQSDFVAGKRAREALEYDPRQDT